MKLLFRQGSRDTISIGKIYEQAGLRGDLVLPRDRRKHNISLVYLPPKRLREKLIRDSIMCVQGWEEKHFLIQRVDTLHLTLIRSCWHLK